MTCWHNINVHYFILVPPSVRLAGQCHPILKGVSRMMGDRLNAIKIDIDSTLTIAADYGIRSVPTMVLVKNNTIVDQGVGGLQWL
jgi:thioredoxin 1